ncbi:hypothetical protein H0H92_009460 [Tricholoma furcatifolium]|nr:hypothetical protein H0H92_009460 [Tricholoma furcatifolium]
MQLKAQLVELEEADTRIIYLKQVIQEKRRAALLLRVLDERERVRIRRFQGLVKTIDKLRTASLDTSSTAITSPLLASMAAPKSHLVQNRHFVITEGLSHPGNNFRKPLRRLKELEYEPSLEIVSRLRIRLTNKIQADQIQATIERLCKVARVKAKRKIRCHDTAWSILSCVSKEQLSANAREIASRKQELQRLSHNAIILGFLCEHLITSLYVFLEQTSPVLRSSLRDSIPVAKGHIDVQRLVAIPQFNDLPKRRKTLSFIEEVCKACGESETVLRVVEGMIERADQQSSYLVTVRALNVPPKSSQEEVLLGGYQTGYQSVEERAQTLLMRKVGKAALGNSIINEIDTLMKDAQTLTGS